MTCWRPKREPMNGYGRTNDFVIPFSPRVTSRNVLSVNSVTPEISPLKLIESFASGVGGFSAS